MGEYKYVFSRVFCTKMLLIVRPVSSGMWKRAHIVFRGDLDIKPEDVVVSVLESAYRQKIIPVEAEAGLRTDNKDFKKFVYKNSTGVWADFDKEAKDADLFKILTNAVKELEASSKRSDK